jgi:hypothetical protein
MNLSDETEGIAAELAAPGVGAAVGAAVESLGCHQAEVMVAGEAEHVREEQGTANA